MILTDVHMHSAFSNDSESDPEDMIRSAIRKGLSVICFTDHYDKDNYDWGDEAVFDVKPYFETLPVLQEKYKDDIEIRIGAEIGMLPHLGPYYEYFTKQYPFDFIIGSSHGIQGHDVASPFLWEDHTDDEAYRLYYEETLEDVKNCSAYDVYGHLDFIVRYSHEGLKSHPYPVYMEMIDEILKQIIADGKGIELNTSGIRYGLGFPHPNIAVLKRYRELGGEIITVGADAHVPEDVGFAFDLATEILREAGFRYVTVFRQRKPDFLPIQIT